MYYSLMDTRLYMFKQFTVREISVAAGLSALSIITQLIHIGYQSPQWGMWVDIVAVSWFIAYFLFGLQLSLLVSLVGAVMITIFAPETWLGAGMKWIASVPILFSFGLMAFMMRKTFHQYRNILFLSVPLLCGILVRCLLVVPLNYYVAIPLWTGMTTALAIKTIPWFIIVLFNVVQGLLDVTLAWIIVYKFKLNRFIKK